jgi:hypothetical protein
LFLATGKGEGELHPGTGHEGPTAKLMLTSLPGRFTLGKKSRYPFYRKLAGKKDRSAKCGKPRHNSDSILER